MQYPEKEEEEVCMCTHTQARMNLAGVQTTLIRSEKQ